MCNGLYKCNFTHHSTRVFTVFVVEIFCIAHQVIVRDIYTGNEETFKFTWEVCITFSSVCLQICDYRHLKM